MNDQYKYILNHKPSECHYKEDDEGLVMVPVEGHKPIPVKTILTKEYGEGNVLCSD